MIEGEKDYSNLTYDQLLLLICDGDKERYNEAKKALNKIMSNIPYGWTDNG